MTPTVVFLDETGREAFRLDGYPRAWHFASAIEYVTSGAWTREPNFLAYMAQRAASHRAQGRDVRPFGAQSRP